MIFRERLQFYLEIVTFDPLYFTMDHSKFIASVQKEEFIKGSADYYIQLQSLNYLYMYNHNETPNLVNFVLMSLTTNHASFMLKAHMLWIVSILVTNIECEKHTAHAACSYIDVICIWTSQEMII